MPLGGAILLWTSQKDTPLLEQAEPVLPDIETTRYTAEQWKSRAMYEEACKLSAERALARAMDVLTEALFAAAHIRPDPVDDLAIEHRAWRVETAPRTGQAKTAAT